MTTGTKRCGHWVAILHVELLQHVQSVLMLIEVKCPVCSVPVNLKSDNVLGWSYVLHLKVLWQLSFDLVKMVKMGVTVASHELIINIDWNVDFDGDR